jgi:CHAP domain-containing protein
VHAQHPWIRFGFPAPGSVPVAGDIVSLGPGGAVDSAFGHTAIVISADQRHGRFRIIGQNFPPGYAGEQRLRVDFRGRHNGAALLNGVWTAASWLELRHRPKPMRHPHPRRKHRP